MPIYTKPLNVYSKLPAINTSLSASIIILLGHYFELFFIIYILYVEHNNPVVLLPADRLTTTVYLIILLFSDINSAYEPKFIFLIWIGS